MKLHELKDKLMKRGLAPGKMNKTQLIDRYLMMSYRRFLSFFETFAIFYRLKKSDADFNFEFRRINVDSIQNDRIFSHEFLPSKEEIEEASLEKILDVKDIEQINETNHVYESD